MRSHRKSRLYLLISLFFSFSIAIALILFAFKQNINAFYTPTQLLNNKAYKNQLVQLGGEVVINSVKYKGLVIYFTIKDDSHQIQVQYQGLLPDLFREGQTVILRGHLMKSGIFTATQVLAKHDENYRPPQVQG